MAERRKRQRGTRDTIQPDAAMPGDASYYLLEEQHVDPARLRQERDKARALRKTPWWAAILQKGECYYCGQRVPADQLTMDHVVPLARGGSSTRGNIVAACATCNRNKKLVTPAEALMQRSGLDPDPSSDPNFDSEIDVDSE